MKEAVTLSGHDHVDGIEVAVAAEAPRKIRLWVAGGVVVVATGTEEAELAFGCLVLHFQRLADERNDLDLVSEPVEMLGAKGGVHGGVLS